MAGAVLARPPAGAAAFGRALLLQAGKEPVSLELDRGRSYRLLVGEAGRLALLEELSGTGLAALVPCEAGLIGNLKVWENLSLPLAWHAKADPAAIEARARTIFGFLGLGDERFASLCRSLPERLSRLECRMVAFTRALLLEPEILVYDRLFEGLNRMQAEQAKRMDEVFRLRFPFRTSLYLESDTAPDLVRVCAELDLR